jgi:hypothetical protein
MAPKIELCEKVELSDVLHDKVAVMSLALPTMPARDENTFEPNEFRRICGSVASCLRHCITRSKTVLDSRSGIVICRLARRMVRRLACSRESCSHRENRTISTTSSRYIFGRSRHWRWAHHHKQRSRRAAIGKGSEAYLLASEKAVSTTSPIGCQVRPSNCISRSCLIGRKSHGPVLILMPGSSAGI